MSYIDMEFTEDIPTDKAVEQIKHETSHIAVFHLSIMEAGHHEEVVSQFFRTILLMHLLTLFYFSYCFWYNFR